MPVFCFFVEVVPLWLVKTDVDVENTNDINRDFVQHEPPLSVPFVKIELCQQTLNCHLGVVGQNGNESDNRKKTSPSFVVKWEDENEEGVQQGNVLKHGTVYHIRGGRSAIKWAFVPAHEKYIPIVYLSTTNPLLAHGDVNDENNGCSTWPCWLVGHSIIGNNNTTVASDMMIDDRTLIRILPMESAILSVGSNDDLSNKQLVWSILERSRNYRFGQKNHLLNLLSGEMNHVSSMNNNTYHCDENHLEKEVLEINHDDETVYSLKVRMELLLSKRILIGTTIDAIDKYKRRIERTSRLRRSIEQHAILFANDKRSKNSIKTRRTFPSLSSSNFFLNEGSLIVYNGEHGSGKTLLVKFIAHKLLNCTAIHVINSTSLLGKYGSKADIALECLLHSITMSTAVKRGGRSSRSDRQNEGENDEIPKICIILDHFDSFLPPSSTGRGSGAGDAAVPVLNSIVSYLDKLSLSLSTTQQQEDSGGFGEFPFPSNTKNPLYNIGGQNGYVVPVRVCLVGVVTTSTTTSGGNSRGVSNSAGRATNILNSISVAGHYLVPNTLTAQTRLRAFTYAFDKYQITLTNDAREKLPILAASCISARGNVFCNVAQRLRETVSGYTRSRTSKDTQETKHNCEFGVVVSLKDLRIAIMSEIQQTQGTTSLSSSASQYPDVSFLDSETGAVDSTCRNKDKNNSNNGRDPSDIFSSSVGGNVEAKRAIEDALAINNPTKRMLMAKFGFNLPTGVLLYGPPGTGKTLLAKAVANLLQRSSTMTSDSTPSSAVEKGTFISLSASDIVRAEVGNSEKLLANAFETARNNTPSVIFIDEFQALFTDRSSGGSSRLTSTLLQSMDDVTYWRKADQKVYLSSSSSSSTCIENTGRVIVVLGATNTPWMLDNAFLRPGRFDSVVHVGLPTLSERMSILLVHVSKMKLATPEKCKYKEKDGMKNAKNNGGDEDKTDDDIAPTFVKDLCEKIATKCDMYSGADLVALCRAAAVRCLNENEDDEDGDLGDVKVEKERIKGKTHGVTEQHFMDALNDVYPSNDNSFVQRLKDWKSP